MAILRPLPISAVAAALGTGAANLLTPDPKEVWTATNGAGVYYIDLDMGAAVSVDTLFAGHLTPGTGLQLHSATGMGTGRVVVGNVGALVAIPARPLHGFLKLAAPVVSRYWSVGIVAIANPSVGIIALGTAFQPTFNREWGGGRFLIDTGAKEELLGGGYAIGEGAIKIGFRWTFGDLTDTDLDALYALAADRGETKPIVVAEDPDATAGLNERLHYGLFGRLEPYERETANRTRWGLSMTEWT
jgi:hypothetical protein